MSKEERIKRQQEFLIKAAYWAVWGSVVLVLLKFVGPVLLPFIIAFLIAWGLSYPVAFLAERAHVNRKLAAVFMVALFYTLVALLLYLLGSRIVQLVQGVYADIVRFISDTIVPMVQGFSQWAEGLAGDLMQGDRKVYVAGGIQTEETVPVGKMVTSVSELVITEVSGVASYLPGVCVNIMLAVIATVFMELEFPDITEFLQRQIPAQWQQTASDIKKYALGTVGKCARSYLLILVMTFTELFTGFLLLQIEEAFAIAFIIALLDILPVLGTGTVLIPWTFIALASGNLRMGFGVLILYLIITVVRNIAEPHLVGRQMGLSPVVMLPCMIVGLHFLGVAGLFGLPFAVSFAKSLNDRGVIHIFSH